jgi:hypothetical protein
MASAGSLSDPIQPPSRSRGRGPSLAARVSFAWPGWEKLAEAERSQLPLWFPVGLALGVSAWFWLPDRSSWSAFLLAAFAAVAGALAGFGWTRWGRALALFALAAAFGLGLILVEGRAGRGPAARAFAGGRNCRPGRAGPDARRGANG